MPLFDRLPAALAVACAAMMPWGAAAQPPAAGIAAGRTAEIIRSIRLAEHNQLGILEYCLARGAVSAEVVALQRAALARLPGAGTDGTEQAEAEGRQGIVAFAASKVPIAEAAMGEGIPVASRCKHMAMTVQVQAGHPPTW